MCWWTKAQIASTRAQPGCVWPNRRHASLSSRSVSQYRLPSRYTSVSSGSSSMACCRALGTTSSGSPVSRTIPSAKMRVSPCGRDDSAAPVSEPVAVSGQWHRGIGAHVIRDHHVGRARIVSVEHQDHRHGLRARIDHVVSDANLHVALLAGQDVMRCSATDDAAPPATLRRRMRADPATRFPPASANAWLSSISIPT